MEKLGPEILIYSNLVFWLTVKLWGTTLVAMSPLAFALNGTVELLVVYS